jgi:hypothetical protein
VATLVGLLLGVPASPAEAARPQITLTLTQRWPLASSPGTWTPYVLTVTDSGGQGFTGDAYLVPSAGPAFGTATTNTVYPVYHTSVSVGRNSQRSIVLYVIDAPAGYQAELKDSTGRVIAAASAQSPQQQGSSAVGILSDLGQADQTIAAALRARTKVDTSLTHFTSAQDFPTSAVYLSGLSTLIVDQFEGAGLSQAQLQALKDFVGLGGTLIEAGGASWRRSLLSLPAELVPMHPTATATADLQPLAELAGQSTAAVAQVASGEVGAGRVTLAAPDGQALVVEGGYGTGRVIELTFDPLGQPFDSQTDLSAIAWTHAINRALSGVQGPARSVAAVGPVNASYNPANASAGPGAWAPGFTNGADQLYSMLNDTPATAPPPAGLLGGLLVGYVLLAGLLNYLFLRTVGRRTLMWVSVPLIAVVFTAGAYAVGLGSRGSNYLVNEVEVLRAAPEGAVEAYTFDGVFPPRNGDVTLSLPANTLVSTAVTVTSGNGGTGAALINVEGRPEVTMTNVPIWGLRPLQTLAVSHPYGYQPSSALPLNAQLKVVKGHVLGSVVNLTSRPVADLTLVSSSGAESIVATSLGPGAVASVDVTLSSASAGAPTAGAGGTPAHSLPGVSESTRETLLRLAETQAMGSRAGELALIGFTDPIGSMSVQGTRPSRASVAALVEPVRPQSADSISGIAPRARLVSTFLAPDQSQIDIYDFDLPSNVTSPMGLSYQMLGAASSISGYGGTMVRSVEVYDWAGRTWRALPAQQAGNRGPGAVALSPGELAQGMVRVRVQEGAVNQSSLSLMDMTP